MQQPGQSLLYVWNHDPAAIVGLLLIGLGSAFWMHIYLTMTKNGAAKASVFKGLFRTNWDVPFQYLKLRHQCGWPAWPVYALWLAYAIGVPIFIYGVAHL